MLRLSKFDLDVLLFVMCEILTPNMLLAVMKTKAIEKLIVLGHKIHFVRARVCVCVWSKVL